MTYVVTLENSDLVWLAFAAGIAAGSGNAAATASLTGILDRAREVTYGQDDQIPPGVEVAEYLALDELDLDEPDMDREPDPRFAPPVVAPSRDFEGGAGPPGRG